MGRTSEEDVRNRCSLVPDLPGSHEAFGDGDRSQEHPSQPGEGRRAARTSGTLTQPRPSFLEEHRSCCCGRAERLSTMSTRQPPQAPLPEVSPRSWHGACFGQPDTSFGTHEVRLEKTRARASDSPGFSGIAGGVRRRVLRRKRRRRWHSGQRWHSRHGRDRRSGRSLGCRT